MNPLLQFATFNLLPALIGGLLVWLTVATGVWGLGVRHGKLRWCLFAAPLIKSTLLLLGIGLVAPWPRALTEGWQARAVGTDEVLPYFLLFTGATVALQSHLGRRARRAVLSIARPAEAASPRLDAALDHVMRRLEQRRAVLAERCGCEPRLGRPRLMIADRALPSPLVATREPPTIVFPAALVDRLDDKELHGALAHEVAHLQLRPPWSCAGTAVARAVAAGNPLAKLMSRQLQAEEEKACDDLAVAATGDAASYAGMLVKAYRFARPERIHIPALTQRVPGLLGSRAMLTERIERLVADSAPDTRIGAQHAAFALLWATLIAVFFTT